LEKIDKERSEALKRMGALAETAQATAEERSEVHKKLSERILAGTEYFEIVTVKGVDRKDHEIAVYALSDEEYRNAVVAAGLSSKDMMDREAVLAHWKLAQAIAPIATRDPNICKNIMPAQTFRILEKVIAISDFPFREPTDIREKSVQPTA